MKNEAPSASGRVCMDQSESCSQTNLKPAGTHADVDVHLSKSAAAAVICSRPPPRGSSPTWGHCLCVCVCVRDSSISFI